MDDISLTSRKDIIQTLEAGLRNLIKQMERTRVLEWAEKNFISSENYLKIAKEDHTMKTAVQFKNALSAYVYLTTWYLSSYN